MALAVTPLTNEPRSFSVGPLKMQLLNLTALAADTSGSFTVPGLSEIVFAQITGLALTAQPTSSGNVVTLAFTAPGANVFGKAVVYGR